MTIRFVTTLFRPPLDGHKAHRFDYSPAWATKLWRNIVTHHPGAEVTCLTDYPVDDPGFVKSLDVAPLTGQHKGWSNLMEMFRPDVVGDRAILIGLDTLFVDTIQPLWERPEGYIVPKDPLYPNLICNALVLVNREHAEDIWTRWQKGERKPNTPYHIKGLFSEMKWLRAHTEPEALWDDLFPGALCSYKVHVARQEPARRPGWRGQRLVPRDPNTLPPGCRVVYFHGPPKQEDLWAGGFEWLEANWR